MTRTRSAMLRTAGVFLLAPAVSLAQTVPTRTLTQPEAKLDHEWTRVGAVRELRDGRLVVLDPRDKVLTWVDAGLRTATQIGRQGQGPGEWENPIALLALGGDSTGVYDNSNQRLKVITPAGVAAGFLYPRGGVPCNAPGDSLGRPRVARKMDARGRFYTQVAPIQTKPDGTLEQVDRSAIVRWGVTCGRDTLGFVPSPILPNARVLPTGGGVIITRETPSSVVPFRTSIDWEVAPDGRLVIVYPDPYRIDIVEPNGTSWKGSPLAHQPLRVSEAHKEAWRAEAEAMRSRPVGTGNAAVVQAMANSMWKEPDSWPTTLPPFLSGALSMGLDGRLWVQRTTAAGAPPIFDVFDATGRLVERVVFPTRSRLVGHGRGVVYLVRIDEDDLEYLERHRLPPS